MIKKILILGFVLFVLAVAGLFLFFNSAVKGGVEAFLPKILGAEVKLEKVKISPVWKSHPPHPTPQKF